jgi:hypothetical protein
MEGRSLEKRLQVGPETWEYDLAAPGETLTTDIALALSRNALSRRVSVYPPLMTLVRAIGWGGDVVDKEADAAVDGTDLAWAVTEMLTGQTRPAPAVRSSYGRLHAVTVLATHYRIDGSITQSQAPSEGVGE